MNFLKEYERIQSQFVDSDVYKAAFASKAGEKVLEDLLRLYYFPSEVGLVDSHQIAYDQGQKEVVHYILRRLSTIEENNDE